uniref:Homeobox domain-containing protein n=1 Tax=Glossina pallidipes TaxID=7398 RepID=A0A1A9ZT72_GLOPL
MVIKKIKLTSSQPANAISSANDGIICVVPKCECMQTTVNTIANHVNGTSGTELPHTSCEHFFSLRSAKRKVKTIVGNPATLSIFAARPNPKKKRKSRTAFTNHQIFELEKRFLYQKYLSPADRDEIAAGLGLSNAQQQHPRNQRPTADTCSEDKKPNNANEGSSSNDNNLSRASEAESPPPSPSPRPPPPTSSRNRPQINSSRG